MGMKQFPKEMANRLMFYYEKKFEKCYFDEDKILSTLSEPLRHQIDDHSAARFYTTVPVFKDVPRSLLLALVRNMEKEIYLPNDMVELYMTFCGQSLIFEIFLLDCEGRVRWKLDLLHSHWFCCGLHAVGQGNLPSL